MTYEEMLMYPGVREYLLAQTTPRTTPTQTTRPPPSPSRPPPSPSSPLEASPTGPGDTGTPFNGKTVRGKPGDFTRVKIMGIPTWINNNTGESIPGEDNWNAFVKAYDEHQAELERQRSEQERVDDQVQPPEPPNSQPPEQTEGSQPPESSDGEDITDSTGGVQTVPEVGQDQPNNPVVGRTPGTEEDVEDIIEDVGEADAVNESNENFTGGLAGDLPDDLVEDNITGRPGVDERLRRGLRVAAYELGKYRQANWLASNSPGKAAIRPISGTLRSPKSNAFRGFAISNTGQVLGYVPSSPFNTLPSIRV